MAGRRGKPVPPAEPASANNGVAADRAAGRRQRSAAAAADRPVPGLLRHPRRHDPNHQPRQRIRCIAARHGSGSQCRPPTTWPRLQARSSRIPLQETAQVAARRLADHLREIGWEATTVGVRRRAAAGRAERPRDVARGAAGRSDYVAAYRSAWTTRCPRRWRRSGRIRRARRGRRWRSPAGDRAVAARSRPHVRFCTDDAAGPGAPLPGLIAATRKPAAGVDGAGSVVHPTTRRARGVPADGVLASLDWPTPAAGAHRTPTKTIVDQDA